MNVRVSHCLCLGRSFDDLLKQARRDGLDLDQLMHQTGAGQGCGLCRPYLRQALQTGQTVFTELLHE